MDLSRYVLASLLLAILVIGEYAHGARAQVGASCSDPVLKKLVGFTNQARIAVGVPVLQCDDKLSQVSLAWSQENCRMGTASTGVEGTAKRCKAAGYEGCIESVAQVSSEDGPEETFKFMAGTESKSSRILTPKYSKIGYGYDDCGEQGVGTLMLV